MALCHEAADTDAAVCDHIRRAQRRLAPMGAQHGRLRRRWARLLLLRTAVEAAYRALDKIDRLATCEEVGRELEASDEQARHAEQQATRRDERRARVSRTARGTASTRAPTPPRASGAGPGQFHYNPGP